MRGQRGFTLLEIMVVVTVMAILAGALLLSARGAGSDRQVEDEARRLDRVLQLLCDEAVIEGKYAGFGYSAHGYGGYEITPQGWRAIERQGPLRVHDLRSGLVLREQESSTALPPDLPAEPQVVCAPTGELGEHDLLLLLADGSGWRFAFDRQGNPETTQWTGR